MILPLRHDNLADVERVINGDPIADPASLLPGDVFRSSWAPCTYVTVTAPVRRFLGEVLVDYVTEAGGHATMHIRHDVGAVWMNRHGATRPAPSA